MDLFGISLVAGLDSATSKARINTEIDKLKGQLKDIKLNINIDQKALNTIKTFNTEMQKLSASANNLSGNINKALNKDLIPKDQINNAKQLAQETSKIGESAKKASEATVRANQKAKQSMEELTRAYANHDKTVTRFDEKNNRKQTEYRSNNSGDTAKINKNQAGEMTGYQVTENLKKQNIEAEKLVAEREKIFAKLNNIENKYGSSKQSRLFTDTASNANIQQLKKLGGEVDKFGQTLANTAKRDDALKLSRSLKTLMTNGAYNNSPDKSIVGKLQAELMNSGTSVKRIDEINNKLKEVRKNLNPREQAVLKLNGIEQEIGKVKELAHFQGELTRLQSQAKKAQSATQIETVNNKTAQLQNEINKRKEVIATIKQQESAEHKLAMAQLDAQRKVNALMGTLSSRAKNGQAGREIEAWHNQVKQLSTTTPNFNRELDTLNKKFSVLSTEVRNADGTFAKFEGQFGAAMLRIPIYAAGVAAMYAPLIGLKDALRQIIEIDTQMTVLNRVSNGQIDINRALEDSVAIAEKLGNTISQVNEGYINFSRQGFRGESLSSIVEVATVMGNVSDLTIDDAASSLTAAMKGFNIEASESIKIVDSLNEVDNNYSITTTQLAQSIQKSAGASQTFGISMERLIGYTTAIGEVSRESGNVIGKIIADVKSLLIDLELLTY